MFNYTSTCCGVLAKKEPLKALKDWKTAKQEEFGGLGTWHCPACRKGCKVTVSKKVGANG